MNYTFCEQNQGWFHKNNKYTKKKIKILLKKNLDYIPSFIKNRKKNGWFFPESIFLRKFFEEMFNNYFEKNKIEAQKIIREGLDLMVLEVG